MPLPLVLAAAGLVAAPVPPAADPTPAFTITMRREGQTLPASGDRLRVVFDVRHDIGGAVVRRRGPAWPRAVVVRLHLAGLEGFDATAGTKGVGRDAAVRHDGYFEVALPNDFFDGNPESFTLEWVDFYRR